MREHETTKDGSERASTFAPAALIGFVCAFLPTAGFASGDGAVDEIVITAAPSEDRVSPTSRVLSFEDLSEIQPVATADVFRSITGVSLRTNSRGDSVVRIRGAEERQTLIFLDGAPLATPWDGRADLALLPAGLINSVEITRGVVPIEYGANAVAGAVDLYTRVPGEGSSLSAQLQHGSNDLSNLSAIASAGLDNGWSFVGGVARVARDAERIADRSSIPFDPSPSRERTNTDLAGTSAYFATALATDSAFFRAAVLHADVERGVAAQGDIDPAVTSPRFWRTPEWQLTQATVNAGLDLGPRVDLRFTGWQQWFAQTIDSYTDYSYSNLDERETGDDDTIGGRLVLSFTLDPLTLRLVSTAQDSTHDQQEFTTSTGAARDLVGDPVLNYRQRLTTLGLEADMRLSNTLTTTVGVARDRASTPDTGDKPAQASLSATGWSAGLNWTPTDNTTASLTIGERSRFPTMRELYGAALGRFLLNPDLKPERSLLTDLTVEHRVSDALTFDVALWVNDSDDTLSQRSVVVDGERRRQRYNTNGTFTVGVEAAGTYYFTDDLRLELSGAWQDAEAERDANGERPELLQRPDRQLNAALDWQATPRLDMRAEIIHSGSAFDLDDEGRLTQLPSSTSANLRGFFDVGRWRGFDIQLTASVDNLTDELVLPQLGLPAPGRTIRVGVRIQ